MESEKKMKNQLDQSELTENEIEELKEEYGIEDEEPVGPIIT